jgi:hypothetical protein
VTRPGEGPSPVRPRAINVAAVILVLGGLFGMSQLFVGDFVITGSLPAKDPIVGVALCLYAASVALGALVRFGRGRLPAASLAALFAILYFAAMARPANAVLGLAHVLVVAVLVIHRRWFDRAAPG